MTDALPIIIIALPFATAVLLGSIASWRIGIWIHAGSATLLFLLACLLPWQPHAPTLLDVGAPETHLVLLTSFIAMTTSWFSRRDVPASLASRLLDRQSVRPYHAACQALTGAILLALLSDNLILTWLALVIAIAAAAGVIGTIRGQAAAHAATRLLLLCGVGLMLALLGTLLLYVAAEPHAAALRWSTLQSTPHHAAIFDLACVFLLIGYAAAAGAVPLHAWLTDAAAEGVASGSILVGAVLVNAPLLIFMRLRAAIGVTVRLPATVLITLGLLTLLLGIGGLFAQTDTRRTVAFAGVAQVGIIMVAIGIGGSAPTFAAWLSITVLALARATALQCQGLPPTQLAAWTRCTSVLALAILPLFMLFLFAGSTVWLLLPLGVGVLLTSGLLFARMPVLAPTVAQPRGSGPAELTALTPIWMQLALILLLAFAMPAPVLDWFNAMATAR